jgi:4-hydroxybenzoyl-CoA reductase subunit beta
MKNFSYFEPLEIPKALSFLAEHKGKAKIMAGGTDLVPQMKRGLSAPETVIQLSGISTLREIQESEEGLKIGAMVTLGSLERNGRIRSVYPGLQAAIGHVAVPSIRNTGTIGGNICLDTKCIYRDQMQTWERALEPCFKSGGQRCYVVRGSKTCHASLAADTVSMLIALKARAKILSKTGERTVPVEDLYTGNGVQPLGLLPDELLAEIFIPRPEPKGGAAYLRYSLRKAVDFPMVSTGVSLVKKNGVCQEARIILGAVAPRPLRLADAEKSLGGKQITESILRDCAQEASREALQISKSGRIDRFTREMITSLVFQALKKAWQAEGLS